ncbi:MAG: alpha/beta hydrolase [Saprospiraceae bacterium]|nr:alpha/beta hydrolase [Saprospiraceae bacterium]
MRLIIFFLLLSATLFAQPVDFFDTARNRHIPGMIDPGGDKLVIIGACYGCEKGMYAFLSKALVAEGYTVVSIEHEQPQDEPLATTGDIYKLRYPVWERGVQNLKFVLAEMYKRQPALAATKPVLIGHSNGGDIAMLYATLYPDELADVISLDHRRMPIPRSAKPRLMSLRAGEFEPDAGVIPTPEEQAQYGIQIEMFENARHIELSDLGSAQIRGRMERLVVEFLRN